jgi:hypothetical protein
LPAAFPHFGKHKLLSIFGLETWCIQPFPERFSIVSRNSGQLNLTKMKKPAVIPQASTAFEKRSEFQRIIQKIKDDKDAVNQFFDGEISGEQLHARGIKFVKAL